jgi:hypothetical protein
MSDEQSVTENTENQTELTEEQFAAELDDLYRLADTYFAALAFLHLGTPELRRALYITTVMQTFEDEVASKLRRA